MFDMIYPIWIEESKPPIEPEEALVYGVIMMAIAFVLMIIILRVFIWLI